MYEYEKAQMAAGSMQKQAQSQQYSQISNSPQFGGDCALKQEGLSSSTQRLQETTAQLNAATWQLREFFGMNVPELSEPKAPRPSGHKNAIDEAVVASRASLDNINLVLEHLRS